MTNDFPRNASAMNPPRQDRLLNEAEAAEFLGYTQRALQNWRVRGGGPAYVKVSARSIRIVSQELV